MGWDLAVAVVAGAGLGGAWLRVDRLQGGSPYLWPLLGASLGIAALAWNIGRQTSDRLRGTDYGEIVRMVDPDQAAVGLPSYAVTRVAVAAAVWTAFVAVVTDGIESRTTKAILYAIVAILVVWAAAGLFTLMRINRRHERNEATIQSLREKIEADQVPPISEAE